MVVLLGFVWLIFGMGIGGLWVWFGVVVFVVFKLCFLDFVLVWSG